MKPLVNSDAELMERFWGEVNPILERHPALQVGDTLRLKPYDPSKPMDKRQEAAFNRWKTAPDTFDLRRLPAVAFAYPGGDVVESINDCAGRFSAEELYIGLFLETPQWHTLEKALALETSWVHCLREFMDAYKTKRATLIAVNKTTYAISPLASERAFLHGYLDFADNAGLLSPSIFNRKCPAWFAFVHYCRATYNIELLPTPQRIADALILKEHQKCREHSAYVERPSEYYSIWGVHQKFMWDFKHNPEFANRILKNDKELANHWRSTGGDLDALEVFLKER